MGGYNQDGHPWGGGRRCDSNRKGHRWTAVLLFLNTGSEDIRKFNLLEFIELHKCVLPCMYPWRRAWQCTPVFLPGESPWTEEPDGLQSIGLQTVKHVWSDLAYTHCVYDVLWALKPKKETCNKNEGENESEVPQSCLTLCNPMDYSLPGSSIHGIFQATILEWVAISFSRRPSWPRDWTWVSCIVGRRFTIRVTSEVPQSKAVRWTGLLEPDFVWHASFLGALLSMQRLLSWMWQKRLLWEEMKDAMEKLVLSLERSSFTKSRCANSTWVINPLSYPFQLDPGLLQKHLEALFFVFLLLKKCLEWRGKTSLFYMEIKSMFTDREWKEKLINGDKLEARDGKRFSIKALIPQANGVSIWFNNNIYSNS